MSLGNRRENLKTFDLLDQFNRVLGTTNDTFWPCLEEYGPSVRIWGDIADLLEMTSRDETATRNLEDEWRPQQRPGGVFTYFNNSTDNNHFVITDNARFSFGDGTTDEPFSLGIWFNYRTLAGDRSLIAKYRTSATTAREYDFRYASGGVLTLELYDEDAGATEIANGDTTVLSSVWNFAVATYDGGETAPVVNIYLNGASDNDGTTAETGSYVAMENTITAPTICARNHATAPAQEMQGAISLPFITGKELSSTEVTQLYNIGKTLLGISEGG